MKKLLLATAVFTLAMAGFSNVVVGDVLITEAFNNATVQPGGPRSGNNGMNFLNVEGSGNGNFASYGVVDFLFATPSSTQTGIDSFSLSLTQSNAAFSTDADLAIYLDLSASLADITAGSSPLAHDGSDPGTDTDVLEGDLSLLQLNSLNSPFSYTVGESGDLDVYNFLVDANVETQLLNRINNGETIRFVIGATNSEGAATWAGFSNSSFDGPTLSISTAAVPEPTAASILGLVGIAVAMNRRRSR